MRKRFLTRFSQPEINFNRYFYRYTPPRPIEEIEGEIRGTEREILRRLAEVTGSTWS